MVGFLQKMLVLNISHAVSYQIQSTGGLLMVSGGTIISIIIQGIIAFGLPIFFLVFLLIKYPKSWKPMLVGAGIFFVFAQVLEAILHQVVFFVDIFTTNWLQNQLVYAIYASLAAGVFEEIGRFIGFRFLLKKFRSWKDGIAYGIGHGGIESMLVVGTIASSNIVLAFLINFGAFDFLYDIADSNTIEELSGIKFILLTTPGYMFILGGVERIIVFPIQIALSLIVLYGVRNRKYIFLLYAIVFHAVVDFLPALSHNLNINIFWVEGYLLVMAIISLIFIFKSKTMFSRSGGESLEHT